MDSHQHAEHDLGSDITDDHHVLCELVQTDQKSFSLTHEQLIKGLKKKPLLVCFKNS